MALKRTNTVPAPATAAVAAGIVQTPRQEAAAQAAQARHDSLLKAAVKPTDIADELATGEFVKKPDLVSLGSFNVIGVSERVNTYKGKTTNQFIYELQLLDGDNRGATCLCSFNETPPRRKLADAVKKHGAVGPFILKHKPGNDEANECYIMVDPDQQELPF